MFGTSAASFNDDGVTALYQHLRAALAEQGPARQRRGAAPVDRGVHRAVDSGAGASGCATWPRSPTVIRAYHAHDRARGRAGPASRRCVTTATAALAGRTDEAAQTTRATLAEVAAAAERTMDPTSARAARAVAGRVADPTPATSRW